MEKAGLQQDEQFGLRDDWPKIELVLSEVIPVYEKVNRYISFGTDLKIRREGIRILLGSIARELGRRKINVVDLGSGPGMMSKLTSAEVEDSEIGLVQLDALMPMMRFARKPEMKGTEQVLGIYEQLPFREDSCYAAMAGFAIRDAQNMGLALFEISRILTTGGRFLIVDLSKPDSRTKQILISIYWKVLSPFLATIASPKLGRKFAALSTTFRRLPTKSEFEELARDAGFNFEFEKYHMMGASAVILLKKRGKP